MRDFEFGRTISPTGRALTTGSGGHVWHLRTFGGLSIEVDNGAAVGVAARRRSLALLALLASTGERGLSREKVVALLWPESDEVHARNSLSQSLVALRRERAVDDAVIGATELRLNAQVITSDVEEFERCVASGALERAATLYQGPFLDGFFIRESAEFERWADEQRRRLHDLCVQTLGRLARSADERSDYQTSLGWWRRLAALEPTSAQAVSGLMRTLAAIGDRAGGLRQFRVYEELMRQEFDAKPDAAVSALAATLFADTAAVAPRASTASGQAEDTKKQDVVRREPIEPTTRERVVWTMLADAVPRAASRRNSWRRTAIAGILLATAALASVGVIAARWNRPTTGHRIVVRSFRNHSSERALDPIGPMAADWIARGLAQTPLVDVATESDIVTHNPSLDPTELGRLVHARYVISGTYYTQGDSLFLQANVWDAEAGRLALPIPAVGDAIKAKTTALERLRLRVTDALVPFFDLSIVMTSRVPPRYEAYQEFLLGDSLYQTDRQGALKHLRAAAQLDSSFIWARLRLISLLQSTGANAARDSAIADLASRRSSLSAYEDAALEVRIAIAKMDYHAAYLAAIRARQLAPLLAWANYEAGEAALLDGRSNEAVRLLQPLDPRTGALRNTVYHSMLCRAYHDLGRMRDLRDCYELAHRQFPKVLWFQALGALGDANGVEQLFDRAFSDSQPSSSAVSGLFELEVHGHSKEARAIARRQLARVNGLWVDSLPSERLLNLRAGLLAYLGEWRELAGLLDSAPQSRCTSFCLSVRAVASAMLGDTADARRRAEAIVPGQAGANRDDRFRALAAAGQKQAALELMTTVGAPAYWWNFHGDITYRWMRGYAPFEQTLKPRD